MRKSKIAREQKRLRREGISSIDEMLEKEVLDAYYHETVEAYKASKAANEMVDQAIKHLDANVHPEPTEPNIKPSNGDTNE